jgi:outer membrane protein assembly factor BamB
MSRTVCTVTDDYVVSLGPKCHVACLDPRTGREYWLIDLVARYGTTVPQWYAGQCPLVEGDRVILAPGGPEALLVALDAASGAELWRTPNPHRWTMTHSSIVPMMVGDLRTYVYCGSGGVVGVKAADGTRLWETDAWKIKIANVPTPVVVDGERLFLSGGYNAGAAMLRLRRDGDRVVPEVLFRLAAESQFGSPQHTPILYAGHIYGVRPDEQLTCLDLDGKVLWTSGASHKFGLGPYLIANGLIYVMDDTGLLTLAQATPEGFKLLAQAQVLSGHDAWGPMAMAGGRLMVRDLTRMVCLDITGG